MIKIKSFEEMTKQAERKINSRDIETMKNTINTIFMSIKDTIQKYDIDKDGKYIPIPEKEAR